ncbi:MAG: glycosyltransferase family 4 protein [Candidatus Micrarchaeia archaeon]
MSGKSVCYYTMGHPLVSRRVGGAEIQLYLIGKELQRLGWQTHYLVDDEGQPETIVRKGQILHKVRTFKRSLWDLVEAAPFFALNSFLTYSHPFFTRVLNSFKADIYHQRGSNIATGYFAHHAKKNARPFVFSIAHIDDCTLSGNMWRGFFRNTIKKRLYLYGLKNANVIIATAEYLRKAMAQCMPNADIRIIPSGHPVPKSLPKKSDPPFAVWVGRTADYKFPMQFIELAQKFPHYKFVMVGAIQEKDIMGKTYNIFAKTLELAKKTENVEILPFQSLEKVNAIIARASVLVDTSDSAGFPNTFIQAWLRKTPVVSLNVDPDEVLCKEKIGFHAKGDFNKLIETTRMLLEDTKLNRKIGTRAFAYARKHHDIRMTAKKHHELYRELIE